MARGQDDRAVEPDRPRRSISVETTFERDLRGLALAEAALAPLAEELADRLARSGFVGRTLTLKLRHGDFRVVSRRTTRATAFTDREGILRVARELLAQRPRPGDAIRLLGLGVSSGSADTDLRQLALPLLKEKRSAAP